MSARKSGAVTTYDQVAERMKSKMAKRAEDEAEAEREWNRNAEARRREWAAELRQEQRQAVRALDMPTTALDLFQRGCESPTPALAAIEAPADILVLSGGVGSGKTVAAVGWLYRWVMDAANWSQGERPQLLGRALFVTASELQRGPRFEARWVHTIERASRLVIDDLGAEYDDEKGVFRTLVDEVINTRHAHRRPTLITTNCDGTVFKARYGPRIADRIREGGRFEWVGAKSLRGAPAVKR